MIQLNDIEKIIKMIGSISNYLQQGNILLEDDLKNVSESVREVNMIVFGYPKVKYQKNFTFESQKDFKEYGFELKRITDDWISKCNHESNSFIRTDLVFEELYTRFKYVDEIDIIKSAIEKFDSYSEEYKNQFLSLNDRYTFLSTSLNYKSGDYSIIEEHVKMMASNVEKYKWLYERLADYRSKEILNGIIEYWFDFNISRMHLLSEYLYHDYYDLDILRNSSEEVMVDCGAYTGDSVTDFISTYNGKYNHIYAFEMTPGTFGHMKNNLSGFPHITCINKAVGNENKILMIKDGLDNAGNSVDKNGDTEIEMTSLDIEIDEPISMIKMDIEGAEKNAIKGARNHILNDKPQLLISSYHIPSDIFEIPMLINEIRDDYKFYLRFNGHGIWPCDYVLFAV